MGKEPGWYYGSQGVKRYWDGSSWTNRVHDEMSGWSKSDRIPFDGPPRGERDPFKNAPPGVPSSSSGYSEDSGGGGLFVLILLFLPIILLYVAQLFLIWLGYVLRWPLLVVWVAFTCYGIYRLIVGPRRLKVILAGLAAWWAIGAMTVNGFEIAPGRPRRTR